jgi:ribose transport system substrate-binding protein
MTSLLTIGVVPQGSLHQHWKFVRAGASKAAADLLSKGKRVNLIWKAPLREDDREAQKKIVEDLLNEGVDGIVLAPFDSRSLVGGVEEAAGRGIPTVVIDSALETSRIVSFIATDNKKGGELAADRMGKLLQGKGRVLLLRYQKGVGSTEAREEGFAERAGAYAGLELIPSDPYSGATRDTARRASEALLERHAHELQGVFTPNESSTAGMLMALQRIRQAGKIAFIGFDTSEMYLDTMRYRQIHGLVVQNPFRMGELGVKTLVDHLQGQPVQKRIDIEATLVTPENMDDPAMQRLLHLPAAE